MDVLPDCNNGATGTTEGITSRSGVVRAGARRNAGTCDVREGAAECPWTKLPCDAVIAASPKYRGHDGALSGSAVTRVRPADKPWREYASTLLFEYVAGN